MPRVEVISPHRSDQLIERGAETLFQHFGLDWKSGLGQVTRELIRENAPQTDCSPLAIAREFGILKRRPNA